MTTSVNKPHTDREYEAELNALQDRVRIMASRVERMIDDSIRALVSRDVALAHATIDMDRMINREEMELDEHCLQLLARRQPLGSDLRLIATILKMVTDLERIGDLAVHICERALHLSVGYVGVPPNIQIMGSTVRGMMSDAIEAFASKDTAYAEDVIAKDSEVDALYQTLVRDSLSDMMADEKKIGDLIHIQTVAKWLERIGDHCTNLAELAVFMVKGTDIRHAGKLEIERSIV